MPIVRRRRSAGARLASIASACLTLALVLCAPAEAAEVGAVTDITWGTSRDQVDRTVALLKESGVRTVRTNLSWSALEPNAKGVIDGDALAAADYSVDAARRAGLEILMPISDGVPYWASADPAKSESGGTRSWNHYWRPKSFADYADIVGTLVKRYKDRGVHHFEIWNEPNHPRFWPSGVNAAEYVQMLKPAAAAVRAADPSATVVLGGLTKNDYPYLERVYAAGGGGAFDVVAVHPYTGAVDPTLCWKQAGSTRLALDAFCGLEDVHQTMVANGDSAKPVWLTEFGWSTNTTQYGVSESRQAEFLTKAYKKLESYPFVAKAYWYSFRNLGWLHDDATQWEANTGLLRTDFSPKPALVAMKAYAGAAPGGDPPSQVPTGPPPTGPPADVAPSVVLTAPAGGSTFTSTLRFAATATDDRGVRRVEFLVDGRVVGDDDSAPYALGYDRADKLAYGAHAIAARAIDTGGASATASVQASRVRATRTVLTVSTAASSLLRARSSRARRSAARIRGRVHGAHAGRVQLLVARRYQRGGWRHAVQRSLRLDGTGRFRGVLRFRVAGPVKVLARFPGSPRAAPSRGRARTVRSPG